MKQLILFLSTFLIASSMQAQQKSENLQSIQKDSLLRQELDEVILIGNPNINFLEENKALGSIDSYLQQSKAVNMIKRGAYAWEPMLNGMSTERSVLTIDGMRIFHACTDKMDPITSYVENTNLSKARIAEGQSGSEFGGTIAGSIDLIRKKSDFSSEEKLGGSAFAGFEVNNKQQIYGLALNYSKPVFYADLDFTYRDAENYKAGHKSEQSSEVEYSKFTKYNISAISGYKLNEQKELEGSVIYDRAVDVGYPGLPMDVSLAEAFIASLEYRQRNLSDNLHLWETKAYFNTITHVMDDSTRPIVPIRMDMPGWSKTQGFYSRLFGTYENHAFKATLSGFRNNSIAEMTMFPNDPNEKDMYMLTWPDVNTHYGGIHFEDNISFTPHLSLLLEGGIGVHHNNVRSELGLNSLRLFYPDLSADKTRILKNLSSNFFYHHNQFLHGIGVGFGDRAPSVSEGYGFYLLNIIDNYDYVGNPNMKNEKSLNVNLSSTFESEKWMVKAKVNYFYIMDYIVGKPREGVPPMNITANGIKVYEQLNHASIFNSSLGIIYRPFFDWTFSANASFRYGQGSENTVLPLIQPFSYEVKARYGKQSYFAEIGLEGSTKNRNSIEFGESQKPGYTLVNLAFSKEMSLNEQALILKLGVENLFDRYYSTFDDWFNIPSMGRNVYANAIFKF